jgi:hypothetical protein
LFARQRWYNRSARRVPLRAKMVNIRYMASKAFLAILVSGSTLCSAYAAEPPLPAYDPGQYAAPVDAGPAKVPPTALAAPPVFAAPPVQGAPPPGATDLAVPGNPDLSMPQVTFRNLLTTLRVPQPAADQYSTPDTTSSYSTIAPTDPAQRDTALP